MSPEKDRSKENQSLLFPDFKTLSEFEDTRPEWVRNLHGVLSDRDIARMILTGEVKFEPMPDLENDLDSCKLNLHLGNKFRRFDYSQLAVIDIKEGIPDGMMIEEEVKPGSRIVIPTGEVIIATTREKFELPNYLMARLEGKSGLARCAVMVEAAPIFDAGWRGYGAMEIVNIGRVPVVLYEGGQICALNFTLLSTPSIKSRDKGFGKYRDQTGPDPTKTHREFQR